MNFLKQKPIIKRLVSFAFIFLLACGLYFVVLSKKNNPSEINPVPDLSLSTTPNPYPLPTKVYNTPSYLTTILGQVFGHKKSSVNPSWIIENSQKRSGDKHLDLYVLNDYLPVDAQWWQQKSKQVYEYVSDRLGETIDEKVIVVFVPPETGNCAARGITFHEQQSIIVVYANQDTSKEQILAVLAHELGHVFIYQKYPNLSDVALTEGMATWAAGDYWKEWKGVNFNASVRSFIIDKTYLSLFQNYDMSKAFDDVPGCISRRDILLTEFASFIDYLIQSRGLDQLSGLYNIRQPVSVNNQRIVYPPNYKEVYGLELNQLEYAWLRALVYNSSP